MKIYKYHLPYGNGQVDLPIGAEVLHFGVQNEEYYIWAKVDEEQMEKKERWFRTFGTGHNIPEQKLKHIGTVMTNNGAYVWHCFEIMK